MQTEDLEQKKLVYLYLMNYAKTQPELVILAVNTFVKVSAIHSTRPCQHKLAGFAMNTIGAKSI